MKQERIRNPNSIDRAAIETKIAAGSQVILQFDKSCYSPELLEGINNLCGEFGKVLEVRFYGHYGTHFDASVLRHLPDVAALSVDCLSEAINLAAIGDLKNLRSLRLDVHNLDDEQILKSLPIQNLEKFSIGKSLKAVFDLEPLQACGKLSELNIEGHTENIVSIARLPVLRELTLRSVPKKQSLDFISKIGSLRRLVLILGGRPDISEIHHPSLEELEIIWVMGFSNLDSIDAFPSLRTLVVEDQIRLENIRFAPSNKNIQSLRISNCKKLQSIEGLDYLTDCRSIRIGMTALDIDSILKESLAESLQIFSFHTGKKKKNAEIRLKLDALGYKP